MANFEPAASSAPLPNDASGVTGSSPTSIPSPSSAAPSTLPCASTDTSLDASTVAGPSSTSPPRARLSPSAVSGTDRVGAGTTSAASMDSEGLGLVGASTSSAGRSGVGGVSGAGDDADVELELELQAAREREGDRDADGEREGDPEVDVDAEGEDMAVRQDQEMDDAEMMDDASGDLDGAGKRVKVYELRGAEWFDRGTGHCKGVYDGLHDKAMLVVEPELEDKPGEETEQPGGFLARELLLQHDIVRADIYQRQQETLIVWTEPVSNLDIALSFQDPSGCLDIWSFIEQVQKHLDNIDMQGTDGRIGIGSTDEGPHVPSSPPLDESPSMGVMGSTVATGTAREEWHSPSLANIRDHEVWLRMQSKSAAGRERAVEHIINTDYIKQLIGVLNQAEDLESVDDLHALCSLMQTILMFNDNGIFEYILGDDVFLGVLGILEYDPEFPTLKASYRQFFQEFSKFRQVVEIRDDTIRNKIHQTARLLYLKDVVLARVLDDPTFGILNSFVFFNQVDILSHIQGNDEVLHDLFAEFREPIVSPTAATSGSVDAAGSGEASKAVEQRKRDTVLFLHQLMVMGKGVQLPNRLALYRTLIDRGLLFVCEWAFTKPHATLLHAGAEMLTLAVEHDVSAVRALVLKEEEAKRRTLVHEIVGLLHGTTDLGLVQQMAETMKTLLEVAHEQEQQAFAPRKDVAISDNFLHYFYENCVAELFRPLSDLGDFKAAKGTNLAPFSLDKAALLNALVELLSFCVTSHVHRSHFWILSNPISQKIASLMYAREKTLRHASLRYFKACLKSNNHFIYRNFTKNELMGPFIDLVSRETEKDTMLSSACLDALDLMRKENMKLIIINLFQSHGERMDALSSRPYVRTYVAGLRAKFEQYTEPPPPPPPPSAATGSGSNVSSAGGGAAGWRASLSADEDAWFNQSDEDEPPSQPPVVVAAQGTTTESKIPSKRKRQASASLSAAAQGAGAGHAPTSAGPPLKRPSPQKAAGSPAGGASSGSLGLDYDDGSDSDGSSGGQSPRLRPQTPFGGQSGATAASPSDSPRQSQGSGNGSGASTGNTTVNAGSSSSPLLSPVTPPPLKPAEELEEDLGDVTMKMRAKRAREAEEDEGFANLMMSSTGPGAGGRRGSTGAAGGVGGQEGKEEVGGQQQGKGGKGAASAGTIGAGATAGAGGAATGNANATPPVKEKKLRLNLGFGKKFGGK